MKKQFLFFAATFIAVAFISCSKEKMDMQDASTKANEEIATSNSSARPNNFDPLTANLDGWFPFNGNLKDQTKKLADGVPTGRGALYTTDRKGAAKAAIKFTGNYGVNLFKVPQQTHASISVWVKYDNPNLGTGRMIVTPKTTGIGIGKKLTEISGSLDLMPGYSLGVSAGSVDQEWHHFVVTFDDDRLRIYKDGQLVTYFAIDWTYPQLLEDYFIGYKNNEWFEGAVDDLRFYSRTLSAVDVQKLYNL